ncbi:unnamed protein product [Protopolystoma xenopodis]|uniref:Uncharacterized protein n=1 Tax=Protopolystoma xenopodis TaxID=117903 RepID=A0A3S5CL98_9PLAT|nr:unnamed protein product [Protopolystoma xenopodis]
MSFWTSTTGGTIASPTTSLASDISSHSILLPRPHFYSTSHSSRLPTLSICVVIRRKLNLWLWDPVDRKFVKPNSYSQHSPPDSNVHGSIMSPSCIAAESCWLTEIQLPDTPKAITFHGPNHLLISFRSEYFRVSLITGEVS